MIGTLAPLEPTVGGSFLDEGRRQRSDNDQGFGTTRQQAADLDRGDLAGPDDDNSLMPEIKKRWVVLETAIRGRSWQR